MASLPFLPLEVVHHILEYLSPQDLIVFRQLTRNLRRYSSVNHLWHPHVLELWKRPIFADVRRIPQIAWAFSHQQDGWFQAFRTVMQTSKQGWIPDEESIRNTCWAVTFIGMDVIREIPVKPHSIVELRDDMNCYTVGGVPLVQHKWWIANGELRVPAYPPLAPFREEHTWGRVMKHIQVLMHGSSPEFLENLLELNKSILETAPGITTEERTTIEAALDEGITAIRARKCDPSAIIDHLNELHFARRRALRLKHHIPDEDPALSRIVEPPIDYPTGDTDDDEDEDEMYSSSDFESPPDSESELP